MKRILLVLGAAVLFLNTLVIPTVSSGRRRTGYNQLRQDLVQAVMRTISIVHRRSARFTRRLADLTKTEQETSRGCGLQPIAVY